MENIAKKTVSSNDLFPVIREFLLSGRKVKITVSGGSMLPWIAHNRDYVLIAGTDGRKLKQWDIILYRNKSGKYILHRICREEADGFHTIGDSCLYEDGIVHSEDILGVVEKIYRKGKEIDCNSVFWRSVFSIWSHLLPIREPLLKAFFFLAGTKRWLLCKR